MHPRETTVVIVPGLRDHVADHWQTLLQDKLANAIAVPGMARDSTRKLSCAAWVDALDRTLAGVEGPAALVAHSAGVMIVVHWALRHRRAIAGALLATPADVESPLPEGYPAMQTLEANGWLPIPRVRLPFPSVVAASSNDPLGRVERIAALAHAWGSRLVDIGAAGHLNPASEYGAGPGAELLLPELRDGA